MKSANKVLSVLLACSMLGASFAGTTAAAASKGPEEGAVMGKTMSSYVSPNMDLSYMQNAAPSARTMLRARAATDELPAAYNAVEAGTVTAEVRNQGGWGTCWAFSGTGAMASNLFDEMGEDAPVFSPIHLAYFAYHGRANPDDPADGTDGDSYRPFEYNESDVDVKFQEYRLGGNTFIATSTLARGVGPVLEETLPYPESTGSAEADKYEDLDPSIQFDQEYRLEETNYLPTRDADGNLDGTAVKKALLAGGSLGISYNSRAYNYVDYNGTPVKTQFGGPNFGDCNHAVQIVGWDDNIPKELFSSGYGTPEHDGAWLIRNSWGRDQYDGLFYMSYDEGSITEVMQYVLDTTPDSAEAYDHLYQYDGTGWSMSVGGEEMNAPVSMANVFTATSDETLKAVSFYTTDANAQYSIQVYTQLPEDGGSPIGEAKAYKEPITGTEAYPGYHTIYLDEDQWVNLAEGEKYSIVVTMENPLGRAFPVATEMNGNFDNVRCVANIEEGESFVNVNGEDWLDLEEVGTNYTAHVKRVAGSSSAEDLQDKPGTSGVNIQVAGDFDGDMWGALGNVCLKAFTTEGNEEGAITPAAGKTLSVVYTPAVTMEVDGYAEAILDATGAYMGSVVPGEEITLSFAPAYDGREIAGVSVNGEAQDDYEKDLYTYAVTMGDEDQMLDFDFTIVNKLTLNATLEIAKELQGSDEYNAALSDVREAIDAAIANAEEVAESATADQATIDNAWSELLNAIQYLQFKNGDMTFLKLLLDTCDSLDQASYTSASWEALMAVKEEAQAMYDAQDSLQEDIDAMADELVNALNNLELGADLGSLLHLIEVADTYEASEYIQNDAWDTFVDVLAEAKELVAQEDPSQADVETMTSRLSVAMAEIRLIPDKSKLEDLIAETADSTDATVKALRTQAIALLANDLATQEEVDALAEELEAAIENAGKPSGGNSSSGNKGSSSSNTSGGNVYAGEGTAVVTSSASVVTAAKSVVSDTTVNFTLKRGSAYCFKMTVVNGSTATPSFTVGNGSVLKTQYVAKVGNDYYFRVYAIGTPGQSTGVYTQMPGEAPVLQCAVTIG